MDYPIISLWQPWAQWVALGWKQIETRTHSKFKGLVGKRIGIHAALRWDRDALALAQPFLTTEQLAATRFPPYGVLGALSDAPGKVICTAFVREHRALMLGDSKAALIECITPRYGLVLEDIQIIPFIPARGKQGIWYLPRKTPYDLQEPLWESAILDPGLRNI